MNVFMARKAIALIFFCGVAGQLQGVFPLNFLRPYDDLFFREGNAKHAQIYAVAEHGFKAQGRDSEGDRVAPFSLWQCDQSTLAMLKGFPADSPITQFAQEFNLEGDDGVRGHLRPSAHLEYDTAIVCARAYLPHNISLSVHVPVHRFKVSDVVWCDLTKDETFEDQLVKQELTGDIQQVVCDLGCLSMGAWSDTGLGDIVVAGQWLKEFPQVKDLLRKVTINFRSGMSLPTAKKYPDDQAFKIPLGNDEAFGIFVGGGIDLKYDYHIRVGADAQFLHLFGSTRERRIKTDATQGDILLLPKVKCRKDFGVTQRYNLFFELHRIFHGLSFRATYQFWQHSQDNLSLFTNEFSTATANDSVRLDDWTFHHIILSAHYEVAADRYDDATFTPELTFYYKAPINGTNSIVAHAVGGALIFNF